ncbi:GyrI-like domain-containing protein [Winogradskyella psychrotolerans]|uniref:GyrI-like domain-containing protein n=1 Tax=Winogradskyella psychrotolerans TaxID=1344585 RepID=UPI001C070A66|nr:GyrI-like domain-containing protein [Winogradskyella psychrotolerans]MBU2929035.1 GyrI-like domain-containing protein [Winogradskyella psychrotolerans]
MNPKIKTCSEIKVIGLSSKIKMNEQHKIVALWKRFMPRKHEIENLASKDLIAMQIYSDFNNFETPFDIWACAEVLNGHNLPDTMSTFTIPQGDYAIFNHKGMDAGATYQKIMTEWLPTSGYDIDARPHFQVMGEKYKNGSPDSEEDFFVPIKDRFN